MSESKVPFLCGGVLFFLLTKAVPDKGSARDHRDGIKDVHADPVLMQDLMYAFTGRDCYYSKTDTSNYKECRIEGSGSILLSDTVNCSEYDHEVRENYASALHRMDEFADRHIINSNNWLVRALLDIIENDDTIDDSSELFIESNGRRILKAEIRAKTAFDLSAFLVGVLHFIANKRRDRNSEGIATLEAISEKKERKPRRYTGNLGENINRVITVSLPQERRCVTVEEQPVFVPSDDRTDDDVILGAYSQMGEVIKKTFSEVVPQVDSKALAESLRPIAAAAEAYKLSDTQRENLARSVAVYGAAANATKHCIAEGIRHSWSRANDTSDSAEDDGREQTPHAERVEEKTTIIQQQTNVIQNGDHNVNVTNNGTMNFNF